MAGRALIVAVGGKSPEVDPGAFVAPTAVVVGEVTVRAGASVWYGAVLRGDCGPIVLGAGSNVQDNCTVHVDPGFPVVIGERVTIGHNAVVHGCAIEDDALIGMGATVLNGAVIGAGSLVAAQALVPQGMVVPPGSLVAGVPAKVRRPLTDEERAGITLNGTLYMELARAHEEAHTERTADRDGTGDGDDDRDGHDGGGTRGAGQA
ncbi:gamma carbonic anhydrase family protein [Streptomyces uncialis]|uniref:gamma carbonic anhydrase family protein n=1 Tax=Streptomyces uncialis TaxID=1048205 RepID=UPI002E32E2E8|nr:gamma carbonic anhydrase family protein [Streptomyces uncialis]